MLCYQKKTPQVCCSHRSRFFDRNCYSNSRHGRGKSVGGIVGRKKVVLETSVLPLPMRIPDAAEALPATASLATCTGSPDPRRQAQSPKLFASTHARHTHNRDSTCYGVIKFIANVRECADWIIELTGSDLTQASPQGARKDDRLSDTETFFSAGRVIEDSHREARASTSAPPKFGILTKQHSTEVATY